MKFYPGFEIGFNRRAHEFEYGEGVFGPQTEIRRLDDIRASLENPGSSGPSILYCIAMDIGNELDRKAMLTRNLLFGAVWYAEGTIGEEPVRSQGHVHAISPSCNSSTCEVYEIWDGEACIYMQQYDGDEPGRCIAVHAGPGDVVVVPPGWVHATVNADPERSMMFGAWCVRDYGFDYRGVREHGGIAYFPVMRDGSLYWKRNERYSASLFMECRSREYPELGIKKGIPIYRQFQTDPDSFLFVSNPNLANEIWRRA